MKVGLWSAGGGVCTRPGVFGRVAEHAEAAGFESLWLSEHLVVSDPRMPPSPMDPEDPIFDPVTALAYLRRERRRSDSAPGSWCCPYGTR